MARRVEITDSLRQRLAQAAPDLEASEVVFYRTIAVSTTPVRKKGTLWEGARLSRSALQQMADQVNSGEKNVPLHTMHQQATELPVGKVFFAELEDRADGGVNLIATFYIPKTQTRLISDIDNHVLNEVSIGAVYGQMTCSACGWNYRGDDADLFNLMMRTCANGHVVGENGVHINLNNLEDWMELSLVSRGASPDAKILSRVKAQASDRLEKIAASGAPAEALFVTANSNSKEIDIMDLTQLTERIEAGATERAELKAELKSTAKERDDAKAELATAQERITELEGSEDDQEVRAELEQVEGQRDAALTFLQDAAKKALVAAGETDPEAPETIEACIESINKSKTTLAGLLQEGGTSTAADIKDETKKAELAVTGFKTRR